MKKLVDIVHITTALSNQTFKILIKQLKDSIKEVAHLKEEGMFNRVKMKELMDGYSHTIDLERFATRKAQPLYRKLKNLYK
jgi:hypothetical protein